MSKTSKTIVFFGNERLATGIKTAAPTLQALIAAGYKIAAVVSNYETGQSRNPRPLEIKEIAERHNIPVLLPDKPTEILDQLRSYKASAGVLAAYGRIVPQAVIDIFPKGIVNIHPSLLPLHRGPTPIESIILNGEARTGVSIMQLVRTMDAGPLFAQQPVKLKGNESKQELADVLLELGKNLLIGCLPGILDGSLLPKPQDNSMATYDSLISKQDGLIDWSKSAKQIECEIRAFSEWPKSRTKLGGKEVIITKAHSVPSEPVNGTPGELDVISDIGVITVCTGNGSLCIERLKPAGKQEMTAKEFISGYGQQLL